jgi:hypothetical protein
MSFDDSTVYLGTFQPSGEGFKKFPHGKRFFSLYGKNLSPCGKSSK